MKAIFLDVDGVLHPLGSNHLPSKAKKEDIFKRCELDLQHGEEEGYVSLPIDGEFCLENMIHLKRIVEKTSACIVLSSTWRETDYGTNAVKYQLNLYKIGGDNIIVGKTTILGIGTQNRAKEICKYLKDHHNEIESYICFDDAELKGWDNNIFNEKNFIRCDKSIGITKEQADHAIELLNIIR